MDIFKPLVVNLSRMLKQKHKPEVAAEGLKKEVSKEKVANVHRSLLEKYHSNGED